MKTKKKETPIKRLLLCVVIMKIPRPIYADAWYACIDIIKITNCMAFPFVFDDI